MQNIFIFHLFSHSEGFQVSFWNPKSHGIVLMSADQEMKLVLAQAKQIFNQVMDKDERLHQKAIVKCVLRAELRDQDLSLGMRAWQCPGAFPIESVVSFSFPEKKSYFL